MNQSTFLFVLIRDQTDSFNIPYYYNLFLTIHFSCKILNLVSNMSVVPYNMVNTELSTYLARRFPQTCTPAS